MTTYYFSNPEEALRQVKRTGKRPGCYYGGITLPSGKRGWAPTARANVRRPTHGSTAS